MWLSMVDEAVGGEVKQSGEGKGSKKWMDIAQILENILIFSKFIFDLALFFEDSDWPFVILLRPDHNNAIKLKKKLSRSNDQITTHAIKK